MTATERSNAATASTADCRLRWLLRSFRFYTIWQQWGIARFTLSSEPGDVPVCVRCYSVAVAGQTLSGGWRSQATAIKSYTNYKVWKTMQHSSEEDPWRQRLLKSWLTEVLHLLHSAKLPFMWLSEWRKHLRAYVVLEMDVFSIWFNCQSSYRVDGL